jgi:hypothetical protein
MPCWTGYCQGYEVTRDDEKRCAWDRISPVPCALRRVRAVCIQVSKKHAL